MDYLTKMGHGYEEEGRRAAKIRVETHMVATRQVREVFGHFFITLFGVV